MRTAHGLITVVQDNSVPACTTSSRRRDMPAYITFFENLTSDEISKTTPEHVTLFFVQYILEYQVKN